uniref:DUF4283 domain-containing protein n=1 Tax=Cannabis sativa TaxID=3483 RepID=A0A803QC83_CANSA
MDDLTNSLTLALNLTDIESTNQTLYEPTPANPAEPEHVPTHFFLVEKLHTVKSFNRKVFIDKMTSNWNHISRFSVTITDRSQGLVLVEFGCEGDRRRVLLQQPWTYLNQPLLMDIQNSLDVLNGDSLLKIPLWVQVFNTPFLKRTEQLAELVSTSLGHLFEVYRPSFRETWGPYFRIRVIYNKGCVDYMKACDEAPLPPKLRYDIKTISGKVKVTTNSLLCSEQLSFANPPVTTFMTSNPASTVCVSPQDLMPPFPTYCPQDQPPTHGQTQLVGLYKSGPSSHTQDIVTWTHGDAQPIITNQPQTKNNPHTFTVLLNATMSSSIVQQAPHASPPTL